MSLSVTLTLLVLMVLPHPLQTLSVDCIESYADADTDIATSDGMVSVKDIDSISERCRIELFTNPFPSPRCSLAAYPEWRSLSPPDAVFLKEYQLVDLQRTIEHNQRPIQFQPEIDKFIAPPSVFVSIAQTINDLIPLWTDNECLGVSHQENNPHSLLSEVAAIDTIKQVLENEAQGMLLNYGGKHLDPLGLLTQPDVTHWVTQLIRDHNEMALLGMILEVKLHEVVPDTGAATGRQAGTKSKTIAKTPATRPPGAKDASSTTKTTTKRPTSASTSTTLAPNTTKSPETAYNESILLELDFYRPVLPELKNAKLFSLLPLLRNMKKEGAFRGGKVPTFTIPGLSITSGIKESRLFTVHGKRQESSKEPEDVAQVNQDQTAVIKGLTFGLDKLEETFKNHSMSEQRRLKEVKDILNPIAAEYVNATTLRKVRVDLKLRTRKINEQIKKLQECCNNSRKKSDTESDCCSDSKPEGSVEHLTSARF